MKKRLLLSLFIVSLSTTLFAQDLAVNDSILNKLHSIKIPLDTTLKDSLFFKVAFPDNYDSLKIYPVLLGLSGGNQSEPIVNYCYAAWFKSNYFKNYLTIMPVNHNGKNLMHYSPYQINQLFMAIKNNFKVSSKDWIIAGTSNGGRATFNFIAAAPELFQGGIVIPGIIADSVNVNDAWKDLRFVLAYGDKDEKDWIKATEQTEMKLSKHVKNTQIVVLKGQGHILPIDFDLDIVYRKYFDQN